MNSKIICTWLVCISLVGPALAQGTRTVFGTLETRVFESDECSFTLPGKDWQWGDPPSIGTKGAKGVVSANNKTGASFGLIVNYVNFELDANAYASFEGGVLSTSGMKKLHSRQISFKGVPGYQLEVESPDGSRGAAVRALFANDRAYCLLVHSKRGSPSRDEAEAVFDKFDFTGTPRPMKPPPEPSDDDIRQKSGWTVTHTIIVIGMAVGIVIGLWWPFHTKDN